MATVDQQTRRPTRVADRHAPTAAPAGKQPREQRLATTPRFCTIGFAVGIGRELFLVAFELGPIDIAFVVLLEHDLPLFDGPPVAVALAYPAINEFGALLALAVDVHPGVEGVLEHRNHVAVADRSPIEGDQLLAVGRSRKVDLVDSHRQQYLPRATQLAEAGEDEANRFLQPQVRIETKADLAVPDVADRDGDAQLTTPRLGARRVRACGRATRRVRTR